ncbi:MAG: pyridoxamine 5'-phosphate oxidase family protein [Verrucomicrobia bacterium]|nr:pyridoxamine 5'-phosphate oxidase family protein [Verrucomicrobiota bacterium]
MSIQNLVITKRRHGELWRTASRLVADSHLAVFTTTDAAGMPHAAWMNILVDSTMQEVVTITAPTTQKIANLQANPQAEWMLASPSLETIVYLSGPTQVLQGDEARRRWNRMPGKSKAYFRNYCDTDDHTKFAVIRTQVTKVVYCRPIGYRKTVVEEG